MNPIIFIIAVAFFDIAGLTTLFVLTKKESDERLKKAKNTEKAIYRLMYDFFPNLTKDQLLDCLLIALDVPVWHMKQTQLTIIDRDVTCGKLHEFIKRKIKEKKRS